MIESQNKVRLGELLVESDVIKSSDLTEAIQVSTRLNSPIGRVLLLSGLIDQTTLEAALDAQPLINEEKESLENVLKALKEVNTTGKPLSKMLPQSVGNVNSHQANKLAGLLLDSEIVSQEQLEQALNTCSEEGVPLGSALVMEGILSPSLFPSILQIQQAVQEGSITKNEAINQVKSTFIHWLKAEESFSSSSKKPEALMKVDHSNVEEETPVSITFEPKQKNESTRLVDLLNETGHVTPFTIQSAFNKTLKDPQKSAALFKLLGLIDENTRKKALKCQSLLTQGQLSKQEAEYVLQLEDEDPLEEEHLDDSQKVKMYFDKSERKSMISKIVGGAVVGVAVAGYSLFRNRSK